MHLMQMVMASDKTQIQTFADWPVSHANRVTKYNRQNPEYRVVVSIRRLQLRTDKNCPTENSWPIHVKNEQHILSKEDLRPQKYTKYNDARDPKPNMLVVYVGPVTGST